MTLSIDHLLIMRAQLHCPTTTALTNIFKVERHPNQATHTLILEGKDR